MNEQKFKLLKIFFLILFFLQIFYIYQFRSGFKFEIIKNPFSKNSGIEFSLPAEVIDSSKIIKKQKVGNFNLSKKIKNNKALFQRIIEFNYPIKFKDDVNIYFYLKEENSPEQCQILEEGNYLYLKKC